DDDGLPKARPIAFSDSPRFQRSHNSVFSAAVNPRRNLRSIATLHLFFKIKCCVDRLRPPLLSGRSTYMAERRNCGFSFHHLVGDSEQCCRLSECARLRPYGIKAHTTTAAKASYVPVGSTDLGPFKRDFGFCSVNEHR